MMILSRMPINRSLLRSRRKLTMQTNLDMNSIENKKAAFNMVNNPHVRLSSMVGKTIHAKDYVIDDVSVVNAETGEVQGTQRLVIRDANGETYHTMGRGLVESFTRVLDVFGDSWGDGFNLVVKQINTSTGKRTYTFDVV